MSDLRTMSTLMSDHIVVRSIFVVFFRVLDRKGVVEGPQIPELQPESLSDFRKFSFFVSDFANIVRKSMGKKKVGASLDSDRTQSHSRTY